MAPPTKHQRNSLPLPAELIIQICENLDQADLKTFRLTCKKFSYAAEASLFRRVLLRRNVESFMKLRLIADHPRISELVKAICYSGKMFFNAHRCKNLNHWSKSFIGQGQGIGLRHRYSSAIRAFSRTLTVAELEVHYKNFCAHRHSEQLMQKHDIETQDLTSVIAKLPQLDEVCFARGEHHELPKDDPISFDQFSSIARETLVEPDWHGGKRFHAAQFTALLKAAHTVQKPLHTIKALGVPWSAFQQSKEVADIMASATKACRYLRIEWDFVKHRGTGSANLAKFIACSPYLQTLEIFSIRYVWVCDSSWTLKLSEILEARAHWPHLKRLKLGSVRATEISLMNLLMTHATSLESLELADVYLEGYHQDGKECHGSWVEILLFLQRYLCLKTCRLGGILSNGLDEAWELRDPDESEFWRDACGRPKEGSCLKHRIERFVVEGGTCPLPTPHAAKESGGWSYIDLGGDRSWRFYSELVEFLQDPN